MKQSEYYTGFTPDIEAKEGLRLYPYGNVKDPLLNAALSKIVGAPVARKTPEQLRAASYVEIMSTIERKAGGSNMFFDK